MADCERCGKSYNEEDFTPEERLIQAIFGEQLCRDCQTKKGMVACSNPNCGRVVKAPIYLNNEPFHPECLPYTEEA